MRSSFSLFSISRIQKSNVLLQKLFDDIQNHWLIIIATNDREFWNLVAIIPTQSDHYEINEVYYRGLKAFSQTDYIHFIWQVAGKIYFWFWHIVRTTHGFCSVVRPFAPYQSCSLKEIWGLSVSMFTYYIVCVGELKTPWKLQWHDTFKSWNFWNVVVTLRGITPLNLQTIWGYTKSLLTDLHIYCIVIEHTQ